MCDLPSPDEAFWDERVPILNIGLLKRRRGDRGIRYAHLWFVTPPPNLYPWGSLPPPIKNRTATPDWKFDSMGCVIGLPLAIQLSAVTLGLTDVKLLLFKFLFFIFF